jgi:hypothetical protein
MAMTLCDDKRLTHQTLAGHGIRVPLQQTAQAAEQDISFMEQVMVKPARGEQGEGGSVDLSDPEELTLAVEKARQTYNDVILEEFVQGEDLRIIVINAEVVAAGARVTVYTDHDQYRGTVLPLMASGHLFGHQVDEQPVSWDQMEVRINAPSQNQADLKGLGMEVGNYVAFDARPKIDDATGFINARHLDDKAGAAMVGPGQNASEHAVTLTMMDQSGPFDYHLNRKVATPCRQRQIPFKKNIFRDYRSDSESAIRTVGQWVTL